MKKFFFIFIISITFSFKSYAASLIVCENLQKNEIVAAAISLKEKIINWNDENVYIIDEKVVVGTGEMGKVMLGDISGMDKTGVLHIAINRFTHRVVKRDGMSREDIYKCNKRDSNDILF